mgnify:CR=1 FL=1|tara:strand:- start:2315 stop:2620 length:306 start_codon:yes stop_codon:yes gene_type:complete
MIEAKERYCKASDEEVSLRIRHFMEATSKLPSVSVSEIAHHEDFADLFESFVGERRRWLELGGCLARTGWERKRQRALYYSGENNYTNKVTARWYPPAKDN